MNHIYTIQVKQFMREKSQLWFKVHEGNGVLTTSTQTEYEGTTLRGTKNVEKHLVSVHERN